MQKSLPAATGEAAEAQPARPRVAGDRSQAAVHDRERAAQALVEAPQEIWIEKVARSRLSPSGTNLHLVEPSQHLPISENDRFGAAAVQDANDNRPALCPTKIPGIAYRLWEMKDIAALIDAGAPKPGLRGPYKIINSN